VQQAKKDALAAERCQAQAGQTRWTSQGERQPPGLDGAFQAAI
jgi:hypothetical protein